MRRRRSQQTPGEDTASCKNPPNFFIQSIASFASFLSDGGGQQQQQAPSSPLGNEEEPFFHAPIDAPFPLQQQQQHDYNYEHSNTDGDSSWAFGLVELGEPTRSYASLLSVATPDTPAVVTVSPPSSSQQWESERDLRQALKTQRRRYAQHKLVQTVLFQHPDSLRTWCWPAYQQALQVTAVDEDEHEKKGEEPEEEKPRPLLHHLVSTPRRILRLGHLLWEVPSIQAGTGLRLTGATLTLGLDVGQAILVLHAQGARTVMAGAQAAGAAISVNIHHLHPLRVLEAIIHIFQTPVGKATSEVLASGLQSVATGVGSAASSMTALHRLNSTFRGSGPSHSSLRPDVLFDKLSRHTGTAPVVAYHEYRDGPGLSAEKLARTRRMMHYQVSLKYFVATVAAPTENKQKEEPRSRRRRGRDQRATSWSSVEEHTAATTSSRLESETNMDLDLSLEDDSCSLLLPSASITSIEQEGDTFQDRGREEEFEEESSSGNQDLSPSPFMCTPQSFPSTPHSRNMVLLQKFRSAEDDIFRARDRLRVHYYEEEAQDERTRTVATAMAKNRLSAVFDTPASNDVQLSCGRHVATKIGNLQYANVKGMVPLLHNCYVYFEMTVLPPPTPVVYHPLPTTLCVGVSTEEMPPHTLVGAWQASVGLCSTGQVLWAGHWWAAQQPQSQITPTVRHTVPPPQQLTPFSAGATVGVLVRIDDDSAVETWDGVMNTVSVTYYVNGLRATPLPHANNMSPAIKLLVPASADVFPTVTLQSDATAVMCRFSSEDMVATTADLFAVTDDDEDDVPHEDVVVYAVDGSVLAAN